MRWTQADIDRFNEAKPKQIKEQTKLTIGIDPDTEKSGVCSWDRTSKSVTLQTLTFFELYEYLNQKKHVIDMVKVEAGWKNVKNNFHGAKNASTAARIGANVGANQETGKKIVEMCQYLGIAVKEVKPLKKVWKSKDGKISHDELQQQLKFRGIPPITGRTNPESRDAALICLNG